jgi:hypothetical protein
MALHLIKLCVGADSIEDLEDWIALRRRQSGQAEHVHVTRMTPKRVDELLDGGSLYWIIKGGVQCRQPILDLRAVTDAEGIGRCQIVLAPKLVRTNWQPRRPFQGWRYLDAADAPGDAGANGGEVEMPSDLRRELSELGLL